MHKSNLRQVLPLVIFYFVIALLIYGCSGGGGSAPAPSPSGNGASLSIETKMISRAGTPVTIPSYATGNVNVSVTNKKTGVTVASRSADYQAGSITFNNEIPTGERYYVSVSANLHHEPRDTFEVVWAGSSEVLVLSESDAAKVAAGSTTPVTLNRAHVGMTYQKIVFVPLYPGKLSITPALPASGAMSPGSVIPYSTVTVFDQFGNILQNDQFQVRLSLAGGAFKPDAVTVKTPRAGVASFDGLVISSLSPDFNGQFKLTASCGNASAASEPMAAAPGLAPNASIAGYIFDSQPATAASPVARGASPASGRNILLVINGVEYSASTDANGFWKLDVNAGNGGSAGAVMRYLNSAGILVKSELSVTPGKVLVARITVDPSGNARVAAFESSVPLSSASDPNALKSLIDGEVEKMKAGATGATSVSGRVIVEGSDSSIVPATGVAGAAISIMPSGATLTTAADGSFFFTGNFQTGAYTLSSEMKEFEKGMSGIEITNDDYGFGFSGVKVRLRQKINSLPAVSGIKVSGRSGDISISYNLSDPDGDACSISLYYSTDGGTTYGFSNNVSGDLAQVQPGLSRTIKWSSAKDFAKNHMAIRVKLVPNDGKADGQAGESAIFSVSNDPNAGLPSITRLTVAGTSEISLSYDLAGPAADACTVEVYYSIDGGSSFSRTAAVSGDLNGLAPGTEKRIFWRSAEDFRSNESAVKVMLVPGNMAGYGQPAESATFFVANDPSGAMPKISYLTINGTSENILISYDISEPDNSPCTVEIYFSTDGGATYARTMNLTGQTTGIIPGPGKIVVWDSIKDIATNERYVRIKIVPSNSLVEGVPVESDLFTLRNVPNLLPALSNARPEGDRRDIGVMFDLDDPDSDLCTVEVYFSLDGGINFVRSFNLLNDTSESSLLQSISVAPGTGRRLVWRSRNDFATRQPSVVLKLKASDEYGYGTSAVSLSFSVDNEGVRPSISDASTTDGIEGAAIAFTLADEDGDSCSVSLSYSLDGGKTFRISQNISGDTASVLAGAGKNILWSYFRDFTFDHDSVAVRLTASDGTGPGAAADVTPFAVSGEPRKPVISSASAEGTSEITITFDLADANGSKCTVEVYHSADGSEYFKAVAVSGDTLETLPQSGKSIVWRAMEDLKGLPCRYLRLVAIDETGAGKSYSFPFSIDGNHPPAVSNVTRQGSSGAISISFDLADADWNVCTVSVYLSKDSGTTFTKTLNIVNADQSLYGLSPGSHAFTWNSTADLGQANFAGIVIKVVPQDEAAEGQPGQTVPFAVNNFLYVPKAPLLQSATVKTSGGTTAFILLHFDTDVSASIIDTQKVCFKTQTLADASMSVLNATSMGYSVNDILLQVFNDTPLDDIERSIGISGDYPGMTFLPGNGIKSQEGTEFAPGPNAISIDGNPALMPKFEFINSGTGIFRTTASLDVPADGFLDIYISSGGPPTTAEAGIASGNLFSSTFDFTISGGFSTPYSSTSHVYYRFRESVSGKKTAWADFGTIHPSGAGVGLISANIVYRNDDRSIKIRNQNVGNQNGSYIGLFDNANAFLGATYNDPMPSGGYAPGSIIPFYVGVAGAQLASLASGTSLKYAITQGRGLWSDMISGGTVPPAPVAGGPTNVEVMSVRYNSGNYILMCNPPSDFSAVPYDIGVHAGSDRLGTAVVASASFSSNTPVTSYLDTSSPNGLDEISVSGGALCFTYVEPSSGNESEKLNAGRNVPAAPAAEYLRVDYDLSTAHPYQYRVKNTSGSNFSTAAGSLKAYINRVQIAQGIYGMPAGSFDTVAATPYSAGGSLQFTEMQTTASPNESIMAPAAANATNVPPAPSFNVSPLVPANENGSGNAANVINTTLATAVVNPSGGDDNYRLGVNFLSAPEGMNSHLVIKNPDNGNIARLSSGPVNALTNQAIEFEPVNAGHLAGMLGDGGAPPLNFKHWVESSDGNASAQASDIAAVNSSIAVVLLSSVSPAGGGYSSGQSVTITASPGDALIYYTTDGSEPTAASTPYSGAISVNSNMTIKAIGIKGGLASSNIASHTYTIDMVAPNAFAPVNAAQTLKSGATSTSTVQTDENGKIYFVKNGVNVINLASILTAVGNNQAFSVTGAGNASANFEYTVTVPPPGNVQDGLYNIYAVDAVGNVSTVLAGWLTIDNTAPTLTTVTISSNNTTDTAYAKDGDTVTVTIASNEDLQFAPMVITGPGGNQYSATVTGSGANYNATIVMTPSMSEMPIPFEISGITDLVGNTAPNVTTTTNLSSVTFDKTMPDIMSINLINNNATIENGDQIVITFNEAMYPNSIAAGLTPGNSVSVSSDVSGQVSWNSLSSWVNIKGLGQIVMGSNLSSPRDAMTATTNLALSGDGMTLTITLTNGIASEAVTAPSSQIIYNAVTFTDKAGNPLNTTPVTPTNNF